MLRPVFFLVSCALFGACSLAYPTHELDEPEPRPDSSACVPNGEYCGNDKVMGDPNTLYRCIADADAKVIKRCEAGCVVAPPGNDDYCK